MGIHILAVLALGAVCALWIALQRASGDGADRPRGCHGCELRSPGMTPDDRSSGVVKE